MNSLNMTLTEGMVLLLDDYLKRYPKNNREALKIMLKSAMYDGGVIILEEARGRFEEHEKGTDGQKIH